MKIALLAATSVAAFSSLSCTAQTTETAAAPAVAAPAVAPPVVATPLPRQSVTIAVASGARQPLLGIGVGNNYGTFGAYEKLSEPRKEQLLKTLWDDTKFDTLRLWLKMDKYAPKNGERDLEAGFGKPYLQIVKDAGAHGLKHLLVTPSSMPSYFFSKQKITEKGKEVEREMFTPDGLKQHGVIVADYIKAVRDKYGVEIEATGIENEPNTISAYTPAVMVELVKNLRVELDARGLQSVKIIAPETASTDGVAYKMVGSLKNDAVAWNATAGIATHSYNMAATEAMAQKIELPEGSKTGDLGTSLKEYWMTESSSPGPEKADDSFRAATTASTFLNDMNHRVTHWIYFIGAMQEDAKDNGTRLIPYDAEAKGDEWLDLHLKYFYLKQLSQAFDRGALFRKSTSSTERDMTWSYGRKTALGVGERAQSRRFVGDWNF